MRGQSSNGCLEAPRRRPRPRLSSTAGPRFKSECHLYPPFTGCELSWALALREPRRCSVHSARVNDRRAMKTHRLRRPPWPADGAGCVLDLFSDSTAASPVGDRWVPARGLTRLVRQRDSACWEPSPSPAPVTSGIASRSPRCEPRPCSPTSPCIGTCPSRGSTSHSWSGQTHRRRRHATACARSSTSSGTRGPMLIASCRRDRAR